MAYLEMTTMALTFAERFRQAQAGAVQNAAKGPDDRPKAQFWINIGVPSGYTPADGSDKYSFISLPVGIPLDTMKPIEIKGRNKEYNDFAESQNKLREMLLEFVQDAKPGESREITGLTIMVRRVDDSAPPVSDPGTNQFMAALAKF
jgi:hypothetical protein